MLIEKPLKTGAARAEKDSNSGGHRAAKEIGMEKMTARRNAREAREDNHLLNDVSFELALTMRKLARAQERLERRLGNEASAPRAARVALEALRHAATLADAALELIPRD